MIILLVLLLEINNSIRLIIREQQQFTVHYTIYSGSHTNDDYDVYLNITDDELSIVYVYALCRHNIMFVSFQSVAMNSRRR